MSWRMTLEFKNITKIVDAERQIYPTNIKLESGSFNILLGTTGAGKTTLMQLMAGIQKPTSGEIWFDGKNVTGTPVQQRNVSVVYQQFINYPNFTVFENIASPLRVAGMSEAEIKSRVGKFSELLRLTPMLNRKPSELSGGQQQRTAMARALVKDADLVLLDEPLANLDFKLREELRDELPRLLHDRNCIVVYATTEPSEALLLDGYTAALYKGRVTQFGRSGEIYRKPLDLTTAQVFSEPPINVVSVVKKGNKILLGNDLSWECSDKFLSQDDGAYQFAIRPHHVLPTLFKGAVKIDGTIKVSELSGSESIIHFDMLGQPWVSLTHGIHPFVLDEKTHLYMDVTKGFYFGLDGRLIEG
jgi:glycerol transport system ATP-binding protein